MVGEGLKTSETKSDKFEVEIKNNIEKFLHTQEEPLKSLNVSRYEGTDTKFYSDVKITNPKNNKNVWVEVKLNKYSNLGGPSLKYKDGKWTCTTTDEEDHLTEFYIDAITKGSEKFISFCKEYLKTDDISIPKDLTPELIEAWKKSGSVDDTDNDVQFITDKIPLEGFGEKIAEYYKTAKYEPVYYMQVDDELYIIDSNYNPLGLRTRDGHDLKTLADAYRIGRIQFRAKGLEKKLKDETKYYYSIVCDVKILADKEKDEAEYKCSFKSEDKWPIVEEMGKKEDMEKKIDVNESKILFSTGVKVILEDWLPEYDNKPVNQWGEKWTKLDSNHGIFHEVDEIVKDCQADPDECHKEDSLGLSSVHKTEDGHYIVTLFGGCNGGGSPRKIITYLAVVKKFAKKLFERFGHVWLIDWTNDCADDVWTVRLAFSDLESERREEEDAEINARLTELYNNDEEPQQEFGVAGQAVEMLAGLVGGTPVHDKIKGFDIHSIDVNGDRYRFVIVRRIEDNLVVYKNDEPGEFFAFDSDLSSEKFQKQKDEFVSKFAIVDGVENVVSSDINEAEPDIGGEKSDTVPETGVKLWIDDIREAPTGFKWIKSVNEFIDYCCENGVGNIALYDTDHDAGDFQKDGGDYIRCFDYLDACGCDNITIHIHSANPVGANNIRRIITKNKEKGWKEIRNS